MPQRFRPATLILVLLTMGAFFASSVHAAKKPSRKDRKAAIVLYQQGNTALTEKRFDEAAKHFEEAYRLDPNTTLLWNVARAYEKGQQWNKAAAKFRAFLATPKLSTRDKFDGQKHLALVESAIAKEKAALDKAAAVQAAADQAKAAEARRLAALNLKQSKSDDSDDTLAIVGWVNVGVGIVALGAGAGLLFAADAARSDVLEPNGMTAAGIITSVTQAEAKQIEEDANALSTGAVAALVVGGLAVSAGLALLLNDMLGGDDNEGTVTPMVGVSHLGLRGTF